MNFKRENVELLVEEVIGREVDRKDSKLFDEELSKNEKVKMKKKGGLVEEVRNNDGEKSIKSKLVRSDIGGGSNIKLGGEVSQQNKNQLETESKVKSVGGMSEDRWRNESSQVLVKYKSIKKKIGCRCGKLLMGIRDDTNLAMIDLFEHIHASGSPNYALCRIPIPYSSLNIAVWRKKLERYDDKIVCEYLQFGFPLDINKSQKLSFNERRNHKGARDYPDFIKKYIGRECGAKRIMGPFRENPLSVPLVVSPMNTVPKDSGDERRVIVDLSWPSGSSVNDGIAKDVYLGEIIDLHYASVEQVCRLVVSSGVGSHIYKRDLRHAYRQIPVDPGDFRYLGYFWDNMLYFDTVLAMGQRNAAMACSRTTGAVIHIHQEAGFSATNYLDDLIGVARVEVSQHAFEHLGQTLCDLGLIENLSKACAPSTVQVVLGIEIDTIKGTLAVPGEKLKEVKEVIIRWKRKRKSSKVQLQSLYNHWKASICIKMCHAK